MNLNRERGFEYRMLSGKGFEGPRGQAINCKIRMAQSLKYFVIHLYFIVYF